jgi:hypothetical protein
MSWVQYIVDGSVALVKKVDQLLVDVWGDGDDEAETEEEIRAAIWKQEHNMPKYSRDCCAFSLAPDEPGLPDPPQLLSYPEKAQRVDAIEVPLYPVTPQPQPAFVWQEQPVVQTVAYPVPQPASYPVPQPASYPVPQPAYVVQPQSGHY